MDTSVLDDSDIAEYLELHSENIIPSGSEDECSFSGDELFEVDVAQQNISEGKWENPLRHQVLPTTRIFSRFPIAAKLIYDGKDLTQEYFNPLSSAAATWRLSQFSITKLIYDGKDLTQEYFNPSSQRRHGA
ncbi:hypothetical protein J6590_050173 [Homalodisca vitripennis]|nr:hypothetical protein J6590_050173 [Homalodisca vitripennis]